MKPKLMLRLAALLAVLTVSITANAQIWVGANLGNPAHSGSIITNLDGSLTIDSGGNDIWNSSDNGFYYYTWASGDFDLRVRAQSLVNSSGYGGNTWSKLEAMVRWSDPTVGPQGSDAFVASMWAPGQNQDASQYRPSRSAGANNAGGVNSPNIPGPDNWLRVTRTNQVFVLSASSNNVDWIELQTIDVTQTANGFGVAWPATVSVGVAVTAHDDNNNNANFTTATFDAPIASAAGGLWSPPTASAIVSDVADVHTYVGSEATFKFGANNNASPVQFPMAYQWYKNGALATGLNKSGISWLAAAADAGTTVQCVSWPQGYPSLTVTSRLASVASVSSATVQASKALKLEVMGGDRNDAYIGNNTGGDNGNNAVAGKLRWLDQAFSNGGNGDNMTRRLTGWFTPWAAGVNNYTFYVCSDDDADLWISSDATPANKLLRAQEFGWSNPMYWTNMNGGGAAITDPTNAPNYTYYVNQKCSDTFTNDTGTPWAGGIPLTGGQQYYIELVSHNGTGGDNFGAYAKLFTDAPPQDGTATTLTAVSNNISMITYQPANLHWTSNPPPTLTVSEGQAARFYASALADGEVMPNYTWYKNGVVVATTEGSGTTAYTIDPSQGTDNNAGIGLVATVPGNPALSISNFTRLTVVTAVFEPGFALNQRWNGPVDWTRLAPNSGNPITAAPNFQAGIPSFQAAVDNPSSGNEVNYTRRIGGLFIPPATDKYVFYCTGDDSGGLFLSTDSTPVNRIQIAQENGWSNPWTWVSDNSGAGNIPNKCSLTYSNNGASPLFNGQPIALGIQLTAGTRYYLEYDFQQGGGGGNGEVTVRRIGDPPPAEVQYFPGDGGNAAWGLFGTNIGILAPKATYVQFTTQPTNPLPIVAEFTNHADFYAYGASDSVVPVGSIRTVDVNGTRDETALPFFFQWFKNGQPIAGATTSHYRTPAILPEDNGAQFMCQMRALGYGQAPNTRFWSNSATATLTVITNRTAPTVLFTGFYGNAALAQYWITLSFSIAMDPTTVTNPANYQLSNGATISGVYIAPDMKHVTLLLDYMDPSTLPVTVTFTGVRSWNHFALASATAVVSQQVPASFTFEDIGRVTGGVPDPTFPGRIWIEGSGYTIAAEGNDIWGGNDGFAFLYEVKNGNFDVVMRQTVYGLSSPWAKVGLMAREGYFNGASFVMDDALAAGDAAGSSRNWNIINDPPAIPTVNGQGNGANTIECNMRPAATSNSLSWASAAFPPQYPNAWLRLKRSGAGPGGGQILTGYGSVDGNSWFQLAQIDVSTNTSGLGTNVAIPLPSQLYVGVCVTAHNNDSQGTLNPVYYNMASFDHLNTSYTGGTAPTHPTLTITPSGTNVIVSWTPIGGRLQRASTFANGAFNWSDLTPGANGSSFIPPWTNSMNLQTPNSERFFRVVVPPPQ